MSCVTFVVMVACFKLNFLNNNPEEVHELTPTDH